MKALLVALTLFAGAAAIRMAYDFWDLFLRAEDCVAIEPATLPSGDTAIYKGPVPCPD